jgi:hypothetical protein
MTTEQVEQPQEHLADGWEPGIPHTDSLCRTFLHHWAEQNAVFAAAAGGTVARTDRFLVADHGHETGFFNGAVLLAPPPDWDGLLDELDPLLTGGTGNVLLWSLWPTPDLRRRGWSLMGHPPLLLRPPADLVPVPPPDRVPEIVRTPAELAVWEDVAVRGYPLPASEHGSAGLIGPGLLDDDRVTFRLSRDAAGRPESASAHFVAHGLAGLAFAATLPEARGQGHWTRHARTRLRARPDLWHAGIFSDFSRPLAEAAGFVPIIRLTLWYRSRTVQEQ